MIFTDCYSDRGRVPIDRDNNSECRTGLLPDSSYPVGKLVIGFSHVHDLRRPVAENAQGDDPVQQLVVPGLLEIFGFDLSQLAALTAAHQFQVPAVGFNIDLPALELVGQEAVGPAGRGYHGHLFAAGVQEPANGLPKLVTPPGSWPGRVVGSRPPRRSN